MKPSSSFVTVKYKVKPGDTLSQIAETHKVSLDFLIKVNEISNPDVIFMDQELWIPLTSQAVEALESPETSNEPMEVALFDLERRLQNGSITTIAEVFVEGFKFASRVQGGEHPDDLAVDHFATLMKAKLAAAREKGRSGWDDPQRCPVEFLTDLFINHLPKDNQSNWIDLANFCMFLQHRNADPGLIKERLATAILSGISNAG